jgi:hypothetical protein
MNAWLLAKQAEMFSIVVEVEGMKALNQYRIDRGETIAYDDNHFQEQANLLKSISEEIIRRV